MIAQFAKAKILLRDDPQVVAVRQYPGGRGSEAITFLVAPGTATLDPKGDEETRRGLSSEDRDTLSAHGIVCKPSHNGWFEVIVLAGSGVRWLLDPVSIAAGLRPTRLGGDGYTSERLDAELHDTGRLFIRAALGDFARQKRKGAKTPRLAFNGAVGVFGELTLRTEVRSDRIISIGIISPETSWRKHSTVDICGLDPNGLPSLGSNASQESAVARLRYMALAAWNDLVQERSKIKA